MTTQYADLSTVSGQTLTASLFAVDGDTVLYTADTVTERTNAKGVYRCTFGEASAISGTYRMILFSGSTPFAEGIRIFSGVDTEVALSRTENLSVRLPSTLVSGRIDSNVGAMSSNSLTAAALATDAVTEIQSGLATSTNITSAQTAIITQVDANEVKIDAIKAKTDNLPTDPADQSAVEAAITVASNSLTSLINALNNISAADVNAQVLDVLQTDTFAELSSPPAATSSLKDKLTWLFMWARNKATQTSSQRKLYADDGTTVVGTESVSDDGVTFTKGEVT